MYRVLSCLAIEHDYRLVVLAVLVCVATTLTTFMMYEIACASRDRRKLGWAALTGVCAGAGIWATHFIAMLAYQGNLPTYYDPVATLASLLIAIGVAACGFAVAASGKLWLGGVGGVLIGVAIGTMHYVGMDALSIPGRLEWDPALVAASWGFGIAIAVLAMLAFHLRSGFSALLSAAGLLTLAICTLHFTAMGAATVIPDPTILFVTDGINRSHMALAVVGVTFIVLMSATATVLISRANAQCESTLREQNSVFEAVLRYLPVGLSTFDRDGRLVMCNPAYAGLYGLTERLTRPGTRFSQIVLNQVKGRDGDTAKARVSAARSWIADHFSKLSCGKIFSETVRLDDGRTILRRIGPIAGGGWVDVEEDITSVRCLDERIEWLAHHDAMTGIANRAQFREHLERQFQCYDPRQGFALHWIDLDNFKEVNDAYGHQAGDELLKSVAHRLATRLRAGDLVGRLGGDEFAVLQVDGLAPERLQVEITETVLLHDSESVKNALRKIHELGVTITLDDFGACFSTLNYLRTFPFKKLKIDRSFVRDVPHEHDCVAIVRSVADLARELNLRSVAEGVETAPNLRAVRARRIRRSAGVLFQPACSRACRRTSPLAMCGPLRQRTAGTGKSGS